MTPDHLSKISRELAEMAMFKRCRIPPVGRPNGLANAERKSREHSAETLDEAARIVGALSRRPKEFAAWWAENVRGPL